MSSFLMRMTLTLILIATAPAVPAETRIKMQGTAIIGNQELPKILYIVPWKQSGLPNMKRPSIARLINKVLTPLDREEFRQQIYYHQVFFGD